MVQQVSHAPPPMPRDAPPAPGEAPGASGGTQGAAPDFLALLTQAEVQGGAASPGDAPPGDTSAHGSASGEALADGDVRAEALADGGPSALLAAGAAGAVPRVSVAAPIGEGPVGEGEAPSPGFRPGLEPVALMLREAGGSPQAEPDLPQPVPAAAQPIGGSSAALPDAALPGGETPVVALGLPGLQAAGRDRTPAAPLAAPVRASQGEPRGGDAAGPVLAESPAGDLAQDTALPFFNRPDPALSQSAAAAPPVLAALGPVDYAGLRQPADASLPGMATMLGNAASGTFPAPVASMHVTPYLRAYHPPLSAQLAPTLLALDFASGADGGPARLTVAIRPAELGALQIVAERAGDGASRIAVFAERPETLQLLVRDAPALETALRAAGIGQDAGFSLSFDLASQGQGDRGGRPQAMPGFGEGADPEPASIPLASLIGRAGLIDLSL